MFYKLGYKKELKKLNINLKRKNIENVFRTMGDLTFNTEPYIPGKSYTAEEVKNIQLKMIEKTKEKIERALIARIEDGEFDVD